MISKIIALMQKPFRGLLLLSIMLILIPLIIGNFSGENFNEKIKISLIIFLILVMIAEIGFRFIYRLYYGSKYNFIKKMPFEKIRMEPHPYLP